MSRTLLGIQTDLTNALVWMVSAGLVSLDGLGLSCLVLRTPCEFFPPWLADGFSLESGWQWVSSDFQESSKYSNWSYQHSCLDGFDFSFNLFSRFLGTIPSATTTIGTTVPLTFHNFSALWQGSSICLFFHFSFYSLLLRDGKINKMANSFLFISYHPVWSSGWDLGIRLYIKIPGNLISLIFGDWFWFVHIPFGSTVKFKSFAQFPENPLSYPIVPGLVLLLCEFIAFAYYVINRFIFFSI